MEILPGLKNSFPCRPDVTICNQFPWFSKLSCDNPENFKTDSLK